MVGHCLSATTTATTLALEQLYLLCAGVEVDHLSLDPL